MKKKERKKKSQGVHFFSTHIQNTYVSLVQARIAAADFEKCFLSGRTAEKEEEKKHVFFVFLRVKWF